LGAAARLDVRSLGQRAAGRQLLSAVTFTVLPGETVGLLGPSGSGKSTLLKACCGLNRPAEGKVLLDGEALHANREAWRTRLGYVPQDDILHTELTVRRAVGYAARLRLPPVLPAAERDALVARAIERVGLSERADVRIARLSGGQRKRASVAVELLANPSILFLDEPTSGQDPHLEATMTQLFRTLAADGTTVVVTTHAMASLELLDLVVVLAGGMLVYVGPPEALLDHFQVRAYEGVFRRLTEDAPATWASRYRRSPLHQAYVMARLRGGGPVT
jgi:ABC-type multidrug transport system ATPase subunit